MPNMILAASILDWIKWPFGYLLRISYQLTHSYAIAIIVFALVIRIVLLPVSIKQQKGLIAQAKLRPKEMKIRNKYKGRNDKATQEKMNAEIMDLYSKEHYSPFSGCLPLVLQMAVILILFYVVTAPITYMMPTVSTSDVVFTPNRSDGEYTVVDEYLNSKMQSADGSGFTADVAYRLTSNGEIYNVKTGARETKAPSAENVNAYREGAIKEAITKWFASDDNSKRSSAYGELNFLQSLKSADAQEQEKVVEAIPEAEKLLEFRSDMFGFIDLLEKPAFFNWLLLIPVLSLLISFASSRITKKLNAVPTAGQTDAAKSMKIMDFFLPLFSAYIAFIVPGSVGFYWMMSNLLMIAQSFLMSKIYPIPKAEEVEAAYELSEKQKKKSKKGVEGEVIETTATEISSVETGKLKDDETEN